MCVAYPGKVIEKTDTEAKIDFDGLIVNARTGLLDVEIGDYCLVHAGCVIQKMTYDEAREIRELQKLMEG